MAQQLNISLSPSVRQEIKDAARLEGMPVSQWVVIACQARMGAEPVQERLAKLERRLRRLEEVAGLG